MLTRLWREPRCHELFVATPFAFPLLSSKCAFFFFYYHRRCCYCYLLSRFCSSAAKRHGEAWLAFSVVTISPSPPFCSVQLARVLYRYLTLAVSLPHLRRLGRFGKGQLLAVAFFSCSRQALLSLFARCLAAPRLRSAGMISPEPCFALDPVCSLTSLRSLAVCFVGGFEARS